MSERQPRMGALNGDSLHQAGPQGRRIWGVFASKGEARDFVNYYRNDDIRLRAYERTVRASDCTAVVWVVVCEVAS